MIILLFYLSGAAALSAWLLLCRRGDRGPLSLGILLLAAACPLTSSWLGWDFSPSFTMLFVSVGLTLCVLGEGIWRCAGSAPAGEKILRAVSRIACGAGAVFVLPAVCIYAAGDDWMSGCVWAGLAGGSLLCIAWTLLAARRSGRPGVGALLELWVSLISACFALACGLRSVALLPYGAGLLALAAGRAVPERRERLRACLLWAGLFLASLFSALPALC